MDFTDAQIERYARHIVLAEVGGVGQAKLLQSKVLAVGAGGLGSPLILYLAAAGVGTIGVVDHDHVSLSNLQRQIAHTTDRVDMAKTESVAAQVKAINPEVTIVPHAVRLDAGNVMDLVAGYDVIADGTDNFDTRFLLNDACYFAGKPLVSAAALRFDGQLATYRAYEEGDNRPCYRCVFGGPPPPDLIPSCSEGGVLGAVVGTLGSLQATEVIKELLGIGETMAGHLLIYDALAAAVRKVRVKRDKNCPLCGDSPTITKI